MNKTLRICRLFAIIPSFFLIGCAATGTSANKCLLSDLQPLVNLDTDNNFGLVYSVTELSTITNLETRELPTSYTAHNGYGVKGDVFVEQIAITHVDGEILAQGLIDLYIPMPPSDVVSGVIDVQMKIKNRKKLESVLDDYNEGLRQARAKAENTQNESLSKALGRVQPDFKYEVTYCLNDPEGALSRQRVSF